jgi:hypothetical protein
MNRRRVAVGAIGVACAVVLASPLGAAPNGKRPIQIDSFTVGSEGGDGSFYLSFGSGGDTGTLTFTRSDDSKAGRSTDKTPEGLPYTRLTETDILKGKKGTLVIRAKARSYDLGFFPQVNNRLGQINPSIGTTWSIVRGTGAYAGFRGGGKWVAVSYGDNKVEARYAGFVQTR